MNDVLEINNLNKFYGKLHAVKDLNLNVEKGNVYGLLGPNGSGKSTTLGMILNVVNPSSGSWKWFGEDADNKHLKKIGAIIESPKFYPFLSAYKNLQIVADIKEVSYNKIEQKLELVGLLDRKNDQFKGFSLGMKQRLAIAGALLNDPEVLILDEPTNGLDPQGIHQVRHLIQQIAKSGTTIILASHLLDEVEKVCSHVVILRNGKALYNGPVDRVLGENTHYFLLEASDNKKLLEVLKSASFTKQVESEGNKLRLVANTEISAAEINQYLANHSIYLSHLVDKKASLEEQFITLTQN